MAEMFSPQNGNCSYHESVIFTFGSSAHQQNDDPHVHLHQPNFSPWLTHTFAETSSTVSGPAYSSVDQQSTLTSQTFKKTTRTEHNRNEGEQQNFGWNHSTQNPGMVDQSSKYLSFNMNWNGFKS